MADTQISAAQVIADFGSYYQDAGQNELSLRMRPYEKFGSLDTFTLYPTEDTILRLSDVTVQEVLQPYQDAFTSKGGVTFNPIQIELFQMKIDQQFNPNSLVNTWLGFLTSSKNDRKSWPFIRWFIEMYLLPKVQSDLELKAIYNGVYAAPTAGTAGNTAAVMNGMKKLINDGITASKITPIATGVLSTDPVTFCEQIETWAKAIDELYWTVEMDLNMNRSLAMRYREGKKKKYNMYYAQEKELSSVLDLPFSVEGLASMRGSDKIFMSPDSNLVLGVKGYSNASGMMLESVDRNVKIWSDWWMGIGYLLPDLIFTNDRDLV